MTKEYQKFQRSVLRFYDFYVEFDGDAPKHVERPTTDSPTESFAVWKKRVLGSGVTDVRVFRPVIVDGRTRVSTIAEEGLVLKQLLQQSTAKVKITGRALLQAAEDTATHEKQEIKKKSRRKVADAKSQAAIEIEKTRNTAYQKAMQVPIDELELIIDQIGESLEPAVKEHLEKLVAKAEKDKFPLEALLRGMIDAQIKAVRVLKNASNV